VSTPGDSAAIRNGDRAWFVSPGDDVLHGTVVAEGPKMLVIDVDGPWSNVPGGPRTVERRRCVPGNAPGMNRGETFGEHVYRCRSIIERPEKIAALKAQAEELGLRVEPKGTS